MARCIVLLRGINVGGHRKVPMGELKNALGRAGFESIVTYIQSGTRSGRELFVAYPDGAGRSKFTLDVIERTRGVIGSARNLNTVRRLIELAE